MSSKHFKKHSRPFMCPASDCDSSFQYKKDSERHYKEIHQRAELYCQYEGCTSKYAREGTSRKDNLKRHIDKKHGGGQRTS